MDRVAVVTGANRGLGLATSVELAKTGVHVVATARDENKLKSCIEAAGREGQELDGFVLDVKNLDQAKELASYVQEKYGKLDILVNNAGVLIEASGPKDLEHASIAKVDTDLVAETLQVNAVGALNVLQSLLPLLKKSEAGRVVNVSSGMGQFSEMGAGFPGYRMSKAAMNALTKSASLELHATNIKINSVCPGWVKTDMGGADAALELHEGIKGIIWAATLGDDGPTGGFFRDGKELDW